MGKKSQTPSVEEQNNATVEIDFGTWKTFVDEDLFEHKPYDARQVITLDPAILVYEDDKKTIVSAKKTCKNIKNMLNSLGISTAPSDIRWHTGTALKQTFGGSKPVKELITFIMVHIQED